MKEKAANHPNGNHMEEVEDLPEKEAEMGEEEAIQDRRPQEAPRPEEPRSPPDLTYPLTYDPSPVPMTRNQWENSPTSSMETELKQKRSSTNLITTSYSTSMSRGLTPQLRKSPWPSRL